jgi:hypothetical protein
LVKTLNPASRVFILSKLLESCFTRSVIRFLPSYPPVNTVLRPRPAGFVGAVVAMISMLALSLGMGGPAVSGLPPGDPSCASGCAVGPFTAVNNMNGQYTVAGEPPGFSTVSADYDKGNVEYFDIYSPLVKTRYSQVYWTMMKSVPLPPALVKRFEGKVMAVTGWESDQVIKDPATNGSDFSIPITWAYNHVSVAAPHTPSHVSTRACVVTLLMHATTNVAALRQLHQWKGQRAGGGRGPERQRPEQFHGPRHRGRKSMDHVRPSQRQQRHQPFSCRHSICDW